MASQEHDSAQPTAARKYMSVPEKIELTGTRQSGGQERREPSSRYRPMRVPDKITLEPMGVGGSRGEGGAEWREEHGQMGMGKSQRVTAGVPRSAIAGVQQARDPPPKEAVQQPQQSAGHIADLDRRVASLEEKVQRLTETVIRRDSSGNQRQGNGFWYVLTFAGWIMVPLAVVFMFHYRKSI